MNIILSLSETDYNLLSNLLKTSILSENLDNIESVLKYLQDVCNQLIKSGNETDFIFAKYLLTGNVKNFNKETQYKYSSADLRETIVYKQSQNKIISILAKQLYSKPENRHTAFLLYQIEKFLRGENLTNLKELENQFRKRNNISVESTLTQDDFNSINLL